jgi:hypothetical protein
MFDSKHPGWSIINQPAELLANYWSIIRPHATSASTHDHCKHLPIFAMPSTNREHTRTNGLLPKLRFEQPKLRLDSLRARRIRSLLDSLRARRIRRAHSNPQPTPVNLGIDSDIRKLSESTARTPQDPPRPSQCTSEVAGQPHCQARRLSAVPYKSDGLAQPAQSFDTFSAIKHLKVRNAK